MPTGTGNNKEIRKSRTLSGRWIAVTALITVLICSAISWALISNLAMAKSEYTSDINSINNTIGHMQDAAVGLDSYASYQGITIRTKLDNIESDIIGINNDLIDNKNEDAKTRADISAVKDGLSSLSASLAAAGTKAQTQADSLDTKIRDSMSGVNNILSAFSSSVSAAETKANSLNSAVASLNTTINDPSSGLTAKVGNLTTTVNGISGLQIIPTISASSGGGTISLAINSNQTVTSQIIAFSVEFRPTSDVAQATTMDASLAALYGAPPVTLNPGGSSSAAVAADHTTYDLYWASGAYHLGGINFETKGTSIVKGAQTKTLAYTYTGSTSYDVTITPEFESGTTSTGASIDTW